MTSVVIDDHLLRDVLAGTRPADLDGVAPDGIATTGLWLFRLCSALAHDGAHQRRAQSDEREHERRLRIEQAHADARERFLEGGADAVDWINYEWGSSTVSTATGIRSTSRGRSSRASPTRSPRFGASSYDGGPAER